MCGIIGCVGKPQNSVLTYNLLTNLLRETKRRGPHATGHYVIDLNGNPFTFKKPGGADLYVKTSEWKKTIQGHMGLIGHTRYTTQGSHSDNKNNHPHVSKSGNLALVHNGIVHSYFQHKNQFTLKTECDSELILKIILSEKTVIRGIKKVYKLLGQSGDFACELIHRNTKTGKVMFYFFRDEGRPGHMIDLRDELGQIIFCSEPAIWKDALKKSGLTKFNKVKVEHLPPYEIVVIDPEELQIHRVKVKKPKRRTVSTYFSRSSFNSGYIPFASNQKPYIYKPIANNPNLKYDEDLTPLNDDIPDYDFGGIESSHKDEEKSAMEELLIEAICDPTKRYFGWEEEVVSSGLMTKEELQELLESEKGLGESYSEDSDLAEAWEEAEEEEETKSIDEILKDPFGTLGD